MEKRLYLKFPTIEDKQAVLDFRKEFLEVGREERIPGSGNLENFENFEEWLTKAEREHNPETCGEGRVPCTQYLTYRISDNKLVGIIQVRHSLNDFLLKFGGHIGDAVRPTERRKGYAVEQILLALEKCKELAIERALITCNRTNTASAKSIIKSGGKLENEVEKEDGTIMQRYWIDIEK